MYTDIATETGAGPDRLESDSAALGRYLDHIGRVPLLDAGDEAALARAASSGDAAATKALVEANLRLVVHFASRYSRRGVPIRDLIAEGNFGLMRAVRTYEARPGGRFANYAVWWIRRHILRCLADSGRSIRLPAHRMPAMVSINRARSDFFEKTGREASSLELSEITGLPVSTVLPLMLSGRPAMSFQSPVNAGETGGASIGDFIADDRAESPAESCANSATKADLLRLVHRLSGREADIVRSRFGLDDGLERTCEDIGRSYGLTRERVRQIQDVALRKLRREYEDISRCRTREEIVEERKVVVREEVLAEFALKLRRAKAKRPLIRPDFPVVITAKKAVA